MVSLEQLEALSGEVRPGRCCRRSRGGAFAVSCSWPMRLSGRWFTGSRSLAAPIGAALWRLYDPQERFLGLGESDADGTLRVRRLFLAAQHVTLCSA